MAGIIILAWCVGIWALTVPGSFAVFEASAAAGNGYPEGDCNTNGIPDETEILEGLVPDCNSNGLPDECDLDDGTSEDCNTNGIPDECDIADGTSFDCNENGIPDECEIEAYRDIELVVIFDTSGSMYDEIEALCTTMNTVIASLEMQGATVTSEILSIVSAGIAAASDNDGVPRQLKGYCWEGSVTNYYGATTPGLTDVVDHVEDWGSAVAVVAAEKDWSAGARRIIIPLSDEGPLAGGSSWTPGDQQVIDEAAAIALANDVVVSPIIGSPYHQWIIDLGEQLATNSAQGGIALPSSAEDIASTLTQIILAGTINWNDCNLNEVPDECDIRYGTSLDENTNGVPDECEIDCNENGIADTMEILIGSSQDCDENGGTR